MSACVQGLRNSTLGCLDMAGWGLLSLLLRCLACADDALRGLAYEALALYADTLERSNFRCNCHALPESSNNCRDGGVLPFHASGTPE
jgi:hypothetical protein